MEHSRTFSRCVTLVINQFTEHIVARSGPNVCHRNMLPTDGFAYSYSG